MRNECVCFDPDDLCLKSPTTCVSIPRRPVSQRSVVSSKINPRSYYITGTKYTRTNNPSPLVFCVNIAPLSACDLRTDRTKDDITLEALPTKEGLQVGVLLFRPDDQRILGLKNAADARKLFEVGTVTRCERWPVGDGGCGVGVGTW